MTQSRFSKIIVLAFVLFIAVVLRAQENNTLTAETKTALIDSISARLNSTYIFPEEAKKMGKLLKKNLKKKYKSIDDPLELAQVITEDMRSVYRDGHLDVFPMAPETSKQMKQDDEAANKKMEEDRLKQMQRGNFGFKKMEILEGNVGYLKLTGFVGAFQGGKTAEAAMTYVQNSDALIIDLRENGGGDPSMIQLISSYFFESPTHLNSFYIRESGQTDQFWTQAFVNGKKYLDKPIYILTSSYTYSAAEEFTYNLKNLERATIVGETTGGGAHPVNFYPIPELGFILKIPFGKAVNPITKTNWEQVGVKPDVEVDSKLALEKALSEAYTTMLENSEDPNQSFILNWAKTGLEAKLNPVTLSEAKLKEFVGQFGPRRVSLENVFLNYTRDKNEPAKLTPIGDDWFKVEGVDFFRIEFIRNESGEVVTLKGHYDNGREDMNMKSE